MRTHYTGRTSSAGYHCAAKTITNGRGIYCLALWLIFLDHIPSDIVSWITSRNYGFSDATEIFVFISGYTAAFVYGRAMREHSPVVASSSILKRAWQVYVAHIFPDKEVRS